MFCHKTFQGLQLIFIDLAEFTVGGAKILSVVYLILSKLLMTIVFCFFAVAILLFFQEIKRPLLCLFISLMIYFCCHKSLVVANIVL